MPNTPFDFDHQVVLLRFVGHIAGNTWTGALKQQRVIAAPQPIFRRSYAAKNIGSTSMGSFQPAIVGGSSQRWAFLLVNVAAAFWKVGKVLPVTAFEVVTAA